MYNNELLKLILETQLAQLKKSSDWWIGCGICLIMIGGYYYILIPYFPIGIPVIIVGIIIMVKGALLQSAWARIHNRYLQLLSIEYKRDYQHLPRTPH